MPGSRERALIRLPVRPQIASSGWFCVAVGSLGTLLVLVWVGTSFSQPTLVPLLLQLGFSLALLPITLISLGYGLWMLAGYNEIEVTPRFLTATCRLWGFGWPRRRNVAGLRGLCLVSFRSKSGIGSRFLCASVGSWDSRSAGR